MFQSIIDFIAASPAPAGVYAAIATLLIAMLELIFQILTFLYDKVFASKEVKTARRTIMLWNKNVSREIKNESLFFDDYNHRKKIFYTKIPVYNITRNKSLRFSFSLYLKSYILTGLAGSGKSALLKNDYLFHYKKHFLLCRRNKCLIFLNYEKLDKYLSNREAYKEFIKILSDSKYKKLYLFLDGIDEIGDARAQSVCDFINDISSTIQLSKLKVSCRTEYANRFLYTNNAFLRAKTNFIIGEWTPKRLKQLAKKILKKINKKQKNSYCKTIINQPYIWANDINSPLLMKIYIYILLYGNPNNQIHFKNKYTLYSQFTMEVVSVYYQHKNNQVIGKTLIEAEINEISNKVFNAYSNGKKNISYSECIMPLLKRTNQPEVTFIHETFFEYFIAHHYLLQLNKRTISKEVVAVFAASYTNDFADFITDALKAGSDDVRAAYSNKLCNIYLRTLDNHIQNQYFKDTTRLIQDYDKYSYLPNYIAQLDNMAFFTLKYEILFRLGRLNIANEELYAFLKFIYYYDNHTKQNQEFFSIVLKRCCAISCSFLDFEDIELDYINHMLPFLKEYDENYDLVNRSHTLVYYGDVPNNNIYNFKDMNPSIPYQKAFEKRIKRLAQSLPQNITEMTADEKKKFQFRAFDLATIYTFMNNRKEKLNNSQLEIINNCIVHFENASKEKNSILELIKDEILKLNTTL